MVFSLAIVPHLHFGCLFFFEGEEGGRGEGWERWVVEVEYLASREEGVWGKEASMYFFGVVVVVGGGGVVVVVGVVFVVGCCCDFCGDGEVGKEEKEEGKEEEKLLKISCWIVTLS